MARTLVGTRIRERRRSLGLTQSALAKAVGISASYLNLIEHNRRGIAGKTLLTIAAELKMNNKELADGADSLLINQLTETAKSESSVAPELARIEEFVGRYPGWAKLLAKLAEISRHQKDTLVALTDRLNHDPFLSETMLQILSNITAIRSTADILATTPDISVNQSNRFLNNLRSESQRLSTAAQSMVDFFEAPEHEADSNVTLLTDDQEFWSTRTHYLPELEAGDISIETLLDSQPHKAATSASNLRPALERYQRVSVKLPLEQFCKAAKTAQFDPIKLARNFNTSVNMVLYRLAHLPPDTDFPLFGLVECDMSGAVLLRKEIPGFVLPQYSSACPLWPIYRAFGTPFQPIRAMLEMPNGGRLITFSIAQSAGADRYDLPALLRSTMIFTSDPRAFPANRDAQPPILAGLHCSVCPRKACAERRIDYILS